MTTTTTPQPDLAAEHGRLVADFDAAAAAPEWPGLRPLNGNQDRDDPPHPEGMPDGHPHPEQEGSQEAVEWPAWATGATTTTAATPPATTKPVGYRAAHMRITAERGRAAEQACIDCGEQAADWSYNHDDDDEIIADDATHAGMAYSLDPQHYSSRCRTCHRAHDLEHAAERAEGAREVEGWERRGWAPEATWELRQQLRDWAGLPDQPLDDLRELIGRHIAAQDEADLDTVTLWIAATHLAALGVDRTFPRLAVIAPTHGAGKSTLLDLIARLSHAGEVIGSTITDALLPRILMASEARPTLCLDEADKTLKPENVNATAILNTGWQRGGTARINLPSPEGGWRPEKIDVFAPIALAGNGVRLADDTGDRTITVRLYRSADVPELRWDEMTGVDDRLRERLAAWAKRVAGLPAVRRPVMPEGIGGRDRDRWEVLASAAAGTQRADWQTAIRERCEADHAARQEARQEAGRAPQEQLVIDLHAVLPEAEAYPSEGMLAALVAGFPARYGVAAGKVWTTQDLGWRLNRFWGLQAKRRTIDGRRQRGFTRDELARCWRQAGVGNE